VPRKPAAAPAPVAAGSSSNQLQAGCDDLQDPQHRFTCIPESSHQPSRNKTNIIRSSDTLLLTVPFTRTELAKRAFRCAAPSVWNSLPSFITNSDSLTTFKSRLKTYFFRLTFDRSIHADIITFLFLSIWNRTNPCVTVWDSAAISVLQSVSFRKKC